MKEDFYEILGVSKGASANEIKNELVKLSETWLDGTHNPDDITIVVCKKKV